MISKNDIYSCLDNLDDYFGYDLESAFSNIDGYNKNEFSFSVSNYENNKKRNFKVKFNFICKQIDIIAARKVKNNNFYQKEVLEILKKNIEENWNFDVIKNVKIDSVSDHSFIVYITEKSINDLIYEKIVYDYYSEDEITSMDRKKRERTVLEFILFDEGEVDIV